MGQNLKDEVKEAKHTETGLLWCGGVTDSTWTRGGSNVNYHGWDYYIYQRKMSAKFQRSYTTPPVVFLDISHVYDDDSVEYGSQLLSVDTHGFSIRCGAHSNGVYDMEIRWISVAA